MACHVTLMVGCLKGIDKERRIADNGIECTSIGFVHILNHHLFNIDMRTKRRRFDIGRSLTDGSLIDIYSQYISMGITLGHHQSNDACTCANIQKP